MYCQLPGGAVIKSLRYIWPLSLLPWGAVLCAVWIPLGFIGLVIQFSAIGLVIYSNRAGSIPLPPQVEQSVH